MAKAKTAYVCSDCGASFNKWQGQCGECGAWNTLSEFVIEPATAGKSVVRNTGYAGAIDAPKITPLKLVSQTAEVRVSTGIGELDRVLGGGLVEGSVVLVGGDPGHRQIHPAAAGAGGHGRATARACTSPARKACRRSPVARCRSGLAAGRPARAGRNRRSRRSSRRPSAAKPRLIVADSIQTLWTEQLTAAPGSVSQVRESAARLVRFAKETGTSVFLVGHVTKEGGIAGPRVLEHMVDAVLYFEGESGSRFRDTARVQEPLRRGQRTRRVRHGATRVCAKCPIRRRFSCPDRANRRPGSVVMVTREGTRPLLVEVQALVDHSPLSNPRRVTLGLEQNRLAMLLAVLHRHGGVGVFDQDVFVNVVGGIRVQETAADLPVLLAVLSSLRDRPLAEKTVAFGEVGSVRRDPPGAQRRRTPERSRDARLQARHRAEGQRAEEGPDRRDGSDRGGSAG